jgi:hypothetical protein
MAQRAPLGRRTQFSHIPILGRSRLTIGILIPVTIRRIGWPLTPKRKHGQLRLGIELPLAPIAFSGSVYFGTSNGQQAPSRRRTQLSHIPTVRRSRHTTSISIPETVARTRWPVTPKRNIRPTPSRHRIAAGIDTI